MLTSPRYMIAPAFVGALAIVGALSHAASGPAPRGDILNGALQSEYETRFTDANPLQKLAVGALASLRYVALSEAHNGAIVGRDGWLFTSEELETHRNFDDNLKAAAQRVADVQRHLAGKNIRLIAAVLPDKADIYAESLSLHRTAAVSRRLKNFTDILDGSGVERIDAAGHLGTAKAHGQVFMRDDTHWSPHGAKAVADAIGARLKDADITRAEVTAKALSDVEFNGDLLSFVPTGPFRGFVGPEQSFIQRFETSVDAGGGLFGDVPVEVALVGTSFSARPAFHFEGFLKRALSADILNVAQEGRGPFAPMEAFLRSEEFELDPPKVVIWEIPVRYVSKEMN